MCVYLQFGLFFLFPQNNMFSFTKSSCLIGFFDRIKLFAISHKNFSYSRTKLECVVYYIFSPGTASDVSRRTNRTLLTSFVDQQVTFLSLCRSSAKKQNTHMKTVCWLIFLCAQPIFCSLRIRISILGVEFRVMFCFSIRRWILCVFVQTKDMCCFFRN